MTERQVFEALYPREARSMHRDECIEIPGSVPDPFATERALERLYSRRPLGARIIR